MLTPCPRRIQGAAHQGRSKHCRILEHRAAGSRRGREHVQRAFCPCAIWGQRIQILAAALDPRGQGQAQLKCAGARSYLCHVLERAAGRCDYGPSDTVVRVDQCVDSALGWYHAQCHTQLRSTFFLHARVDFVMCVCVFV